jgi:hypothetical protein
LIKDLVQRGRLIQYKNLEEVKDIEFEIHKSKDEIYNTRICGAFITFETDSHLSRAIKLLKKEKHHFDVTRAHEPSTYIWENLGFTAKE